MNKKMKKLSLHRETLRHLAGTSLKGVGGGIRTVWTYCIGCTISNDDTVVHPSGNNCQTDEHTACTTIVE